MLSKLKKWLKIKDPYIFDIVAYGSAVKGKTKPNDIDLAVIFREGTLKERLEKIQKIKRKIKLKIKVDIKGFLLEDLFKPEFFGRTGIFLEGISLFKGKEFSKKIGFQGKTLFTYSLKDKTHTEKVKFNYVLKGRGKEGMVKKLKGKQLAASVYLLPIKNSLEFEEVLKMHKINYKKENILLPH